MVWITGVNEKTEFFVSFSKKKYKPCQRSDGRRFPGSERSDATLHRPENCTSPLLCCYVAVFRLSAPVIAAVLAFSSICFQTGHWELFVLFFIHVTGVQIWMAIGFFCSYRATLVASQW